MKKNPLNFDVFFLYYTSYIQVTQAKFCTKFCSISIFWEDFSSYFTHAKVCTKLCSNSIFGRIFFLCYTSQSLHKIRGVTNFCANIRFFLLVYTWFSNDSASLHCLMIQGLLQSIWTEGCSGRSSNPGPALAILVLWYK